MRRPQDVFIAHDFHDQDTQVCHVTRKKSSTRVNLLLSVILLESLLNENLLMKME
jgi:hypothetical protein